MGKVVAFPALSKRKRHKIFITLMVEWDGYSAEEAALDCAKTLAPAIEPIADFYSPSSMVWGEFKKKKTPRDK